MTWKMVSEALYKHNWKGKLLRLGHAIRCLSFDASGMFNCEFTHVIIAVSLLGCHSLTGSVWCSWCKSWIKIFSCFVGHVESKKHNKIRQDLINSELTQLKAISDNDEKQ